MHKVLTGNEQHLQQYNFILESAKFHEMIYTIFGLPFLVLAEEVLYTTRSQQDAAENCLPFSNETLWWNTDGYVRISQDDNDGTRLRIKSSLKFYGGLTQDDLFEGQGGLIGTTMVLANKEGNFSCAKKPNRTRLLVCSTLPTPNTCHGPQETCLCCWYLSVQVLVCMHSCISFEFCLRTSDR